MCTSAARFARSRDAGGSACRTAARPSPNRRPAPDSNTTVAAAEVEAAVAAVRWIDSPAAVVAEEEVAAVALTDPPVAVAAAEAEPAEAFRAHEKASAAAVVAEAAAVPAPPAQL